MDFQSTVGARPRITPFPLRSEELDFVLTSVENSLEMKRPFVPIWHEIQDNLLVRPTRRGYPNFLRYGAAESSIYFNNPPHHGYSVLKDPESHQINEGLTSQAMQILLGDPQYMTAAPRGRDDPEKAREIANILMATFDQPMVYGTMHRAFKDAFGFGTSYIQVGWQSRSRDQMMLVPIMDDNGFPIIGPDGRPFTRYEPRPTLYRLGPSFDLIDVFDAFPDPNGTRIHHDMEWFIKRFRISPQHAQDLAEAGVYDREAVGRALDRLSSNRPGGQSVPKGDQRWEAFTGRTNKGVMFGFEFYGRSPLGYTREQGGTNRMITVLHGEVVRSHILPFMDGEIPVIDLIVNPVAGRHYGFSPHEANRYLQDSTDSMLMNLTDASNWMTRPNLLVGNFGGNPEELRRRDQGLIMCRDVKQVAPLPGDPNVIQMAMAELARRKQAMRESSGRTDPTQAISSSDRKTATEVSELTRFATQRVDVMTRLLERDDLPILGRLTHSRLRQFVPPGSDMMAVLNGEPLSIPIEAIDIDADIRFGGTRLFETKFQQAASMREFLNILGQFPDLLITAPEVIVRYGRDILGIEDAEPIVAKMVERTAMLQMARMEQEQDNGAGANTGAQEQDFGTESGETEREGRRVA